MQSDFDYIEGNNLSQIRRKNGNKNPLRIGFEQAGAKFNCSLLQRCGGRGLDGKLAWRN